MRIDGKVAFITGASGGIGAACAAEFARAGARLALAARSAEGLTRSDPGGALLLPSDLTQDDARRQPWLAAIRGFVAAAAAKADPAASGHLP